MEKGVFYGVSVGPGDPELMTLKAARIIESCAVAAAPRTRGEHALALTIAAGTVDMTEKEILYLDFLMTSNPEILRKNHEENAEKVIRHLAAGRSVAMLNLGDASLYSTFSYLAQRVQERGYPVETIPGVTSFCACAALGNQSLTRSGEPLCIYPGSWVDVEKALDLPGGKVFMKPGENFSRLAGLIQEKHLEDHTMAVRDCGLATQKVYHSLDEVEWDGYFLTLLIRP